MSKTYFFTGGDFMRIKNEIKYVISCVLYLTKHGENRIVSSNEISKAEGIPHLFSLRILKKLEKSGLVTIFKGAKGGYKLTKPGSEINLREAMETIEPVISMSECTETLDKCKTRTARYAVNKIFSGLEKEFVRKLEAVNFRQLADETYGI